MKRFLALALVAGSLAFAGIFTHAATILLPQNRLAFYTDETIEVAVAGLDDGQAAALMLTPADKETAVLPVSLAVTGTGSTVTLALPPNALAPGTYQLAVGDAKGPTIEIARGVWPSTMLVSQTGEGYQNFHVSNAFNFGLRDRDRQPAAEPRQPGQLKRYADLVATDIPALTYMYWTGYVLHKPWGIHKEYASTDMIENMRLFNFHVAQRLRRYDDLFYSIGSIDEPGLPWGRTAAGGSASGFTGWNVADWMAERGLEWTDDPGSLNDEDFRKYMQLRALMMREQFAHAAEDIKTVWPTAVYATDLYAPQAVGDGTDPMNQIVNDIPTTHVFADYGIGKLGVLAGLYVEKAHDPTSKVAHAMNGQLFGNRVPHPGTVHAYHLMMNVLLAAGLDSNWWLNFGGMGINEEGKGDKALLAENLERVNEPAARIGPLFTELAPRDHDIAVLWSNTEIWMRVKGVMKAEASNADGEQIALMVADLPEDAVGDDGKLKYNAYSVGGNYKGEVMATLMAVNRAGYPAHVLHEDRLPDGALDDYRVLVITHQTHELPADRRAAIENWVKQGGTLIIDKSSTVTFAGATVVDAPSLVDQGYAWGKNFGRIKDKDLPENEKKQASYYQTNHFMESFSRDAAPVFRDALAKTPARQVLATDSVDLACERHVGGDAELIMVINGYEQLPDIPDTEAYYIWNYAPYEATYRLPIIEKDQAVYRIEGLDWKTVSRVADPTAAQTGSFAPGEMKLYLVVPTEPAGLDLDAKLANAAIQVEAELQRKKLGLLRTAMETPWPIEVTVTGPAGETVVSVYRAIDATGEYAETIPLGMTAPARTYTVSVSSPVAGLAAETTVTHQPAEPQPRIIQETARVFDADAIRALLATNPALTIAVGDPSHQAIADKLASELQAKGIEVTVKPEKQVWRKALYPRVWDPYIQVYHAASEATPLPEGVEKVRELVIESEYYDAPTITTADGKPFEGDWKEAGTVLTVGPKGYIDIGGRETFYETGCRLAYVPKNLEKPNPKQTKMMALKGELVETKTTDEVRAKWARPWQRVVGHVGAFNLTPQLPEVYAVDDHLILLGDSQSGGALVRALQASELLLQVVDDKYPGPGKALVQFAWSPFALEKNVIFIGASDVEGLAAGVKRVIELAE